jgi:hypothetical protein
MWGTPHGDVELMPEEKVLSLKLPLRFEEVDDQRYDQAKDHEHATDDVRFYLSRRIRSDEIFGRDRVYAWRGGPFLALAVSDGAHAQTQSLPLCLGSSDLVAAR